MTPVSHTRPPPDHPGSFTINALHRVTQRLTLDFLSPDILRLSSSWLPLYSPFPSMRLAEQYPSFPPTLLPLPFLSFLLLFLIPPTLSSSLQYHFSFTLSYIPTVIVSSFLTLLFTRHWPWSDLCFIPTSYLKPGASSLRRQGHAPDSQSIITVLPPHHPCMSRVPQDILLPVAESFVHASANTL